MAFKEVEQASKEFKHYLSLGEGEVSAVAGLRSLVEKLDSVVDEAVAVVLRSGEALEVAKRANLSAERARELFRSWLELTLTGDYGDEHAAKVCKIGLAHAKAGVPEKLMILQMGVIASALIGEAVRSGAGPEAVSALTKAMFWNLALMIYSYQMARRKSLERTAGISERLFERLVTISATEIYEELASLIFARGDRSRH